MIEFFLAAPPFHDDTCGILTSCLVLISFFFLSTLIFVRGTSELQTGTSELQTSPSNYFLFRFDPFLLLFFYLTWFMDLKLFFNFILL
jgi:hypothetical protein